MTSAARAAPAKSVVAFTGYPYSTNWPAMASALWVSRAHTDMCLYGRTAVCAFARCWATLPLPTTSSDSASVRARKDARSEEHTSELQSLMRNSYAVFCLKKHNYLHRCTLSHPYTFDRYSAP